MLSPAAYAQHFTVVLNHHRRPFILNSRTLPLTWSTHPAGVELRRLVGVPLGRIPDLKVYLRGNNIAQGRHAHRVGDLCGQRYLSIYTRRDDDRGPNVVTPAHDVLLRKILTEADIDHRTVGHSVRIYLGPDDTLPKATDRRTTEQFEIHRPPKDYAAVSQATRDALAAALSRLTAVIRHQHPRIPFDFAALDVKLVGTGDAATLKLKPEACDAGEFFAALHSTVNTWDDRTHSYQMHLILDRTREQAVITAKPIQVLEIRPRPGGR